MRRVALIQPLPALAFRRGVEVYSEFPSLGFSVLGGVLRKHGFCVNGISYPSDTEQVKQACRDADVVVLGDFRYYAYFCNPLPLVRRALEAMDTTGYDGLVLVAGRHAAWLHDRSLQGAARRSFSLRICGTMRDLAQSLDQPDMASVLGGDVLPDPRFAPMDLLLAPELRGSVSRPTSGTVGQFIVHPGCRYRCAFCEKAGTGGSAMQATDLRCQVDAFVRANVSYVIVWDEVFGADAAASAAAMALFRAAGLSFGCNSRVDRLTPGFVDALAAAGCRSVLLGVELAGHEDEARRALHIDRGKNPGRETLERTIGALRARGIDPVASVIIGLPDDTDARIVTRLRECESLGFERSYVRPLVPFPETSLYRKHVEAGSLAEFADWDATRWDSYPHGYSTLCEVVDREVLCSLARRPT